LLYLKLLQHYNIIKFRLDETVPIQKNVTDFGANITEGAKGLVENMGEGIQNFSNGNLEGILISGISSCNND
jgi:hypothetical protein